MTDNTELAIEVHCGTGLYEGAAVSTGGEAVSGTYVDVDAYEPTPRSSDPAETIADLVLVARWLLGELDKADAVIADRERQISELYTDR